jgi:hypothetical protein
MDMAKKTTLENENVYFPHFIGARHDRKIKRVRKELGIEGYGIFFMLLEILREQSDLKYPMDDIDLLADEFDTSEQKIRVVICNYGLFEVDENELFFSPKQIEYLQPYFAKSSRAKHAALARWNKVDANAMQMHSNSNANAMQVKERKVKESIEKEKEENSHAHRNFPTVEQCRQVAQMSGHHPKYGEAYFYMRDADGWVKPRGRGEHMQMTPISNWRSDYANCKNKGYLETKLKEETINLYD